MSAPTPPSSPEIDPKLVLAYIERGGELGACLVREARWRIVADHLAAENAELRKAAPDDPTATG